MSIAFLDSEKKLKTFWNRFLRFMNDRDEDTLIIFTDLEGEEHPLINAEFKGDSITFSYGFPDDESQKGGAFSTQLSTFSGSYAQFSGDSITGADEDDESFEITRNVDPDSYFAGIPSAVLDVNGQTAMNKPVELDNTILSRGSLEAIEKELKRFFAQHNLGKDVVIIDDEYFEAYVGTFLTVEPDKISLHFGASGYQFENGEKFFVSKRAITFTNDTSATINIDGEKAVITLEDEEETESFQVYINTSWIAHCYECDSEPDEFDFDMYNGLLSRVKDDDQFRSKLVNSPEGQFINLRRELISND